MYCCGWRAVSSEKDDRKRVLTLEDLASLRSGARNPIVVGELSAELKLSMGLAVPVVYLSAYSLAHINQRHPDISDLEVMLLPYIIQRAWVGREKRKKEHYIFSYFDRHLEKRFSATLKVANPDREVYVATLFRAHTRQMISWQKRCEKVRNHL